MLMTADQTPDRLSTAAALGHRRNPRASILLIEDDAAISSMLQELLESGGYRVWVAENGADARGMLDESRPDLILLDLMLPDIDGLVLCADLKAQLDVPIIICSATTRKRDAILGLRLGADDFVAKPFDIYDLEARIEAVLRRAAQRQEQQPAAEPDHYRIGDLVVDRSRRRVTLGGDELQLTPTEYRLLSTMASRPDEVFTRDELAQRVWGYQDASSGRAIDVHIRRLRVKLDSGPVPPPPIISVRGFGYKISRENREQRGKISVVA
ncbi:MAG: two-component system, OmpR family, response regulator VicR [Chloroflexota bacterium]|jgi:two-component system response regulator MtrA|nr:two-component system, OmpR family, response regulator VicR [Chloroflexota bacterium]